MAEIAIAFVAFATIVIVFRQSIGGDLTRLQILVARTLIEVGLAIALFSLMPIVLYNFEIVGPDLWRTCNVFLGCFLVSYYSVYAIRRLRATGTDDPPPGITYFFVVGGSLLVGLYLIIDAVLWALFSAYTLGLVWSFVACCAAFVWSLAVFVRPANPGQPGT